MKWDKSGLIVKVRQFDQYVIRVNGSGGVTIFKRSYLRKLVHSSSIVYKGANPKGDEGDRSSPLMRLGDDYIIVPPTFYTIVSLPRSLSAISAHKIY